MKLIELKLENFAGIRSADFKLNGQSAGIYGDNATGKTTVFNAVTWLLFGKSSTGAKNFTPKTKGPDGDLHNMSHSAEGTFSVDGGRLVTLKKVFHENYKKKRGSAVEEFDGHSIDFYIDGVPVKEKEYETTILTFCGGSAEKMKMLTMPNYFPEEMTWDARRKILLEMCGDVSDEDVINSTAELKELTNFLLMPGTSNQYYTVDEYRKKAAAKKSDINKLLLDIPGRVDEVKRAMPDITGIDINEIDTNINELNTQKSCLETEKAQALSGDTAEVAIRSSISEANAKLAEARAAYAKNVSRLNEDTYNTISILKSEQIKVKNRIQDKKSDLEMAQKALNRLTESRNSLLSEYKAVQKEEWDEENEICPTCKRPLPKEDIQRLHDAFNLEKSKRLEEINQKGSSEASKEMVAEKEESIRQLKAEIENAEKTVVNYEQEIEAMQDKLMTPEPFESTKEYIKLTEKIASYRSEESGKVKMLENIDSDYTAKIKELSEKIRKQEELKTQITLSERHKKRITELEIMESRLSQQYEEIEHGVYLCELFIKAKVSLLTEKINGKFKNVRFRLFQEQVNGGIKEDCEVMIPDEKGRMVPFTFANNAARINAGLEIINTLSSHWELTMPVFIDNAESVTRLQHIEAQVIRLVVSEADKKLRLEAE
ncbi:MAG: AAA family ATPase [Clostridia bacterium]|jgi:hypothetical protein|nr:AAA family ATPase [Clostridia bacterium]